MNLGVSLFFNELSNNLINSSQLLHEQVELIHREVKINFDDTSISADPVIVSLGELSNELQAGREIFVENNKVTFDFPNKNTFGPNMISLKKHIQWIGTAISLMAGGIMTFVLRKQNALAKLVAVLMTSSKANADTYHLYSPEK